MSPKKWGLLEEQQRYQHGNKLKSRAWTGATLPPLVEFLQKEKTEMEFILFSGHRAEESRKHYLGKRWTVFHVQLSSKFVLILEN